MKLYVPLKKYLTTPKTVDIGWWKKASICRYKMMIVSFVSYLVSSLVYVGMVYLVSYLDSRKTSHTSA